MLAAGLALVAVIVFRGGDGEETDAPAPRATSAPEADPLSYPRQGLRLMRPPGWTAQLRDGVIRLRAPMASVAISTDGRDVDSAAIRSRALSVVRRGLALATRTGRSTLSFGGLRAPAHELRGRAPGGAQIDVVVAGADGRWRTYGVTIVRAEAAPAQRLEDIAAILASVRIHRPRRVR